MPKNLKGGNKAKKGKNSSGKEDIETKIILKPDDSGLQHFAILDKYFGGTANVVYINGTGQLTRSIALIRGAVRKRCKKYFPGDLVLICEREFEKKDKLDAKVDLVHKYFEADIRELKKRRTFGTEFTSLIDSYALASTKGQNDINRAYAEYDNDNIRFSNEDNNMESEETIQPVMKQPSREMPPTDDEDESEEEDCD